MPGFQTEDTPEPKNNNKRRNIIVFFSAAVLLSAAVAVTCSVLRANRQGEITNGSSPTKIFSTEDQTDSSVNTPGPILPSETIVSPLEVPRLRSQVPTDYPTVSLIDDLNKKRESQLELESGVPSAYPTLLLMDPDEEEESQLEIQPQVPCVHRSFSKCSQDISDIIEVHDFNNTEATIFDGPITDFLVAKRPTAVTSQNNGCAKNEAYWKFVLETDKYPWETSWELMKGSETIAFGPPEGRNYARRTKYIGRMCLESGQYTLKMKDQGNDGICCKWGQGSYSASVDGNTVCQSDGSNFRAKNYRFGVNAPSSEKCFTKSTYEAIDNDIAKIKNDIGNAKTRSHFLGGIVRLAAHDFMDFNPDKPNPMGPDGCFDGGHAINNGLEKIWCPACNLALLYQEKYSHISRADFWVASANAVIRQTSVGNALDMKDTFLWGRKDADSCNIPSGDRLPTAAGCDETEEVFLRRMKLEWRDAVALMGAHTLGRGDFSGHSGTWVNSHIEAQIFDNKYYDELFNSVWWPIKMGQPTQDWVTGRDDSLMLNTDICLVYDIEDKIHGGVQCCTKTNGECRNQESKKHKCPMYSRMNSRFEAMEAAEEMLGGSHPHNTNIPFYNAFEEAWRKATTVGQDNLSPLGHGCDSFFN